MSTDGKFTARVPFLELKKHLATPGDLEKVNIEPAYLCFQTKISQ